MTFLRALQTCLLETRALNKLQSRVGLHFEAALTALLAAPRDLFVVVGEGFDQCLPILVGDVFVALQQLQEIGMTNLHVASLLHTTCLAAVHSD